MLTDVIAFESVSARKLVVVLTPHPARKRELRKKTGIKVLRTMYASAKSDYRKDGSIKQSIVWGQDNQFENILRRGYLGPLLKRHGSTVS